jgi:hypothetical protein
MFSVKSISEQLKPMFYFFKRVGIDFQSVSLIIDRMFIVQVLREMKIHLFFIREETRIGIGVGKLN